MTVKESVMTPEEIQDFFKDIDENDKEAKAKRVLEYLVYRVNTEREIHPEIVEKDGKKYQLRDFIEEREIDGQLMSGIVSRLVEVEEEIK